MSEHFVRAEGLLTDHVRPIRDLLRQAMPNGRDGFVAEDIDLLLRWFGPNYGQDQAGAFALVEVKRGEGELGHAQRMTFGLLDRSLRAGPDADRYLGLWVLNDLGPDAWRLAIDLDDVRLVRWLTWAARP